MNSFFGLIALAFTIFNMAAGEIGEDDKNFLTLSKFTQILEASVGTKLSPEEIKRVVKIVTGMIDKNGDGLLQYQEMVQLKTKRSVYLITFRLFDKNENGSLDMRELRSFPGWKWLSKMTEDSFKNVLKHDLGVDLLGLDDQMDFEEFLRWQTIANPNTTFLKE